MHISSCCSLAQLCLFRDAHSEAKYMLSRLISLRPSSLPPSVILRITAMPFTHEDSIYSSSPGTQGNFTQSDARLDTEGA